MANDFSQIMPTVMAQFLIPFRPKCWFPRLANKDFADIEADKGDVVNVTIANDSTTREVTPAKTAPDQDDRKPGKVAVTLSHWRESGFVVSDKDLDLIGQGTQNQNIAKSAAALASFVNRTGWANYKKLYGFVGTPATTPFGGATPSLNDAVQARRVLHEQDAPDDARYVVLDPAAEGNALLLMTDAAKRGDQEAIISGRIAHTLGMDWFMDKALPQHTAGVINAGAITANGVQAVGVGASEATAWQQGTLSIAKAAGANGTLKEGDIISIAGDTQTYVVREDVTLNHTANTTVKISPPLKKATVGGEVIILKASHQVNIVAHRDCFVFASRKLKGRANPEAQYVITDPETGLTIRAQISREWMQDRLTFDILFGTGIFRPELGVRLAG